jgi:uncharacterized protein YaiE (UPF0345 family)
MPEQVTQFNGVTVIAKANVYFDGNVVSHTVLLPGGARKTLGLIRRGSFHFSTQAPEVMEIVDGGGLPSYRDNDRRRHHRPPGHDGDSAPSSASRSPPAEASQDKAVLNNARQLNNRRQRGPVLPRVGRFDREHCPT